MHSDTHRNLRILYQKYTDRTKLTQTQFAALAGWTQGAVSQYLNGITPLNPRAILTFAQLLEVHPNEIDPSFIVEQTRATALDMKFNNKGIVEIRSSITNRKPVVFIINNEESQLQPGCAVVVDPYAGINKDDTVVYRVDGAAHLGYLRNKFKDHWTVSPFTPGQADVSIKPGACIGLVDMILPKGRYQWLTPSSSSSPGSSSGSSFAEAS